MRKFNLLAFFSLLICLFIYLFFRTQWTVINQIAIYLFSYETYVNAREAVQMLQLPVVIIYSLPEGLWIFATCLLSQRMYLSIFNYKMKLIYLPILFAIPLELMQLLELNKGKFDASDLLFSLFFWIVGFLMTKKSSLRQNLFKPFTWQKVFFILAYTSVFLAHVWI